MLVSYKGCFARVVGEFEKQIADGVSQLFFILRLPTGKLREVPACRCPIVVTETSNAEGRIS